MKREQSLSCQGNIAIGKSLKVPGRENTHGRLNGENKDVKCSSRTTAVKIRGTSGTGVQTKPKGAMAQRPGRPPLIPSYKSISGSSGNKPVPLAQHHTSNNDWTDVMLATAASDFAGIPQTQVDDHQNSINSYYFTDQSQPAKNSAAPSNGHLAQFTSPSLHQNRLKLAPVNDTQPSSSNNNNNNRGRASSRQRRASGMTSRCCEHRDCEERTCQSRQAVLKHSRSASTDRSLHHRQRSKSGSTSASTHNLHVQISLSHQLVPLKHGDDYSKPNKLSPLKVENRATTPIRGLTSLDVLPAPDVPISHTRGMKLGALQLALPRSFELTAPSYGLESERSKAAVTRRQGSTTVEAASRDDCAPVAEMKPRPRICRTRSTTYLETMFPC